MIKGAGIVVLWKGDGTGAFLFTVLIIVMIAVQKLILHMPQFVGEIHMNLMRIDQTF